jgi:hypothetical protein
LEVRLEIFGCLTHAEWARLASHNRRTGKVLVGNTRYLAPLPQLKWVWIVRFLLFIYKFIPSVKLVKQNSVKNILPTNKM